jgi:cell division protein FtsI/penicillin-binding protein 2
MGFDDPMNRRILLPSVLAGVLVVGLAAGGALWLQQHSSGQLDEKARASADAFAAAWSAHRLDDPRVRYAGQSPAQVAASFKAVTGALGTAPVKVTATTVSRGGDTATATLHVRWTLAGGQAWVYDEPVTMKHSGDTWAVVANGRSSLWHPSVPAGSALVFKHSWGKRGDILDRNGQPLLAVGTVYDIQIDPARATPAAASTLEVLTNEPRGSLVAKLAAAKKAGAGAPIPVITYREADFRARLGQLDQLPGVVYPSRSQPLASSRTFGQPLLGSYGAVTAEMLSNGKGRYVLGDYAGLSGLQGQYDTVLGGTPGVTVTVRGRSGAPLFEVPAKDGSSVKLTLDPTVQAAAEKALAGSHAVPSAMVAVDVRTGDLLAVANSPELGFNRALRGHYQPGSTLKVATTYSLLSKGLTPQTQVPCAKETVVDGLKVQNYEGETFGQVPFSVDFAHSCNTAFVSLTPKMADGDVHDAATALGIGTGWGKHLGVSGTFDGDVPVAGSATERAATAFGQARTSVSPVALAVMAGSVARGSYVEPALVTSPAVAGADRTPKPLSGAVVPQLQALMRQVVTEGTGTAVKAVPGAPVYGKTGTAEYGNASPPATRAWFVGWQGNVAFAVLVEEGKSGGTVAAPLAATFLSSLR